MTQIVCPREENWCTSDLKVIKTSFLWTINNFSKCREKSGESLNSCTFSAEEDIQTEWSLSLCPNGNKEESKDFVTLFLTLEDSDNNEVFASFKLGIIDGNKHLYFPSKVAESLENTFKSQGNWGLFQFIRRSSLNDPNKSLLTNDNLTVYCEITYSGERQTNSGRRAKFKRPYNSISDEMTQLYEKQTYCDVDIVVKGHKFTAHKLILKMRSSVFAAMFEHPMKESQQNRVVIEDIDKEVFSRLLRFIYTDKVINANIDSNLKLLSAADKYNLEDLKNICEDSIGSQLTVRSVSNALIVADKHSAQVLKTKAIDFIKSNSIKVMKTPEWKQVMDRKDILKLI